MNVIPVKKTGYAPFRAFSLMNLILVKKIGHTFFEAFGIKNSIFVKITQLASATLKAILAKVKKAIAACFKEVN